MFAKSSTNEGRHDSVDDSCYLAVLRERVKKKLATATLSRLFWVQNGALHHCSREAKLFLMENFHVCVIGCDTETLWPTHNTNLNHLDIQISAAVQGEVYAEKPPDAIRI